MTGWHDPSAEVEAAERARRLFTATFGGRAEGVWSAPGRVNLIGEHVDYAGGVCLPFALPHRTYVAVRARSDQRLHVVSDQAGQPWAGRIAEIAPGRPHGWAAYLAGVAWAMQRDGLAGAAGRGVDAAVTSDVPVGAGLSSSAALECALAVALADLYGPGSGEPDDPVRSRIAAACVRAENEIALAATGGMDQTVALRARAGQCLRLDCSDDTDRAVRRLLLDLPAHGLDLLVINTNAPHRLVDGRYRSRRAAVEHAARLLGVPTLRAVASVAQARAGLHAVGETDPVLLARVRHVVTEIRRATAAGDALADGRVRDLAPLLDSSHASLRDDYEVSCPELDSAVDAARGAGALGARMTGGGFGGSAIALVTRSDVSAVAEAVTLAAARRALAAPSFLRAVPSAAAGRSDAPAAPA